MSSTTYPPIIVFSDQLGTTNEVINAKFEYCQDFTGDGKNDIRVTLSLDPASNSGTENIIGVAFDIANDAVSSLSIAEINGSPGPLDKASLISVDGITIQTFNLGQGNLGPYDVGIQFTQPSVGQVQEGSFIITSDDGLGGGFNLNAEALLEGTNWYVRLQETDDGEESAKTGGYIDDLPPCGGEPPPEVDGVGRTPGFWKNHTPWPGVLNDVFAEVFGLYINDSGGHQLEPGTLYGFDFDSRKAGDQNKLLDALNAGGGDFNALARHATAALLNATASGQYLDINYCMDTYEIIEPNRSLLNNIDSDENGCLSPEEVIGAVQAAWMGNIGVEALKNAFEAMNEMEPNPAPSLLL